MSLNRQDGRSLGARSRDREKPRRPQAERDHVPHASIVKVIEVLAESDVSWEDAAARALEMASRSVRNIKSIYVSDQQAVVSDGEIAGFRLNAKISFAVEDHEQEPLVTRGRLRAERQEKSLRGEGIMPNRDYEDSPYNRNEGRSENRDEWRDMSNRGSRDWDRRGDEFRQSESQGGARFGRESSSDPYRSGSEQRYAQSDWSRSVPSQSNRYGEGYDQDRNREGGYAQDWRHQQTGQDFRGQQYGQDYRNQQTGQDYRSGGYVQDFRAQGYGGGWRNQDEQRGQRNFNQDWRTQGFNQDWRGRDYNQDYSRSQSNYGARDAGRTQGLGYGGSSPYANRQTWLGQGYRNEQDRDEESWGQQIRHAGQQVARTVKRAFRGPKGYRRSDERIREDVSDRLASQDELDPSEIEVTVSNGEVTLTGTVQSRHEKFQAEELADDVSGVNEVHNQLRVRREDIGTAATSSTSTTSTLGQGETNVRNRNARA